MKKTRFTEEQMVTILREADQRPVPEVAKKNGVSAQTLCAWRKHFGTLEPADVKRLRQLEQENGRPRHARSRNTTGGTVDVQARATAGRREHGLRVAIMSPLRRCRSPSYHARTATMGTVRRVDATRRTG